MSEASVPLVSDLPFMVFFDALVHFSYVFTLRAECFVPVQYFAAALVTSCLYAYSVYVDNVELCD